MSIVSNVHTVVPFVAGKTQPFQNQRLAKIGYKPRGKNPARFASVAVSVPQIASQDIETNINRLLPYVGTLCESAQDGIIRGLYESSGGNLSSVLDSDISIEAVIGYLEAEALGSRLTKEKIESWFDSELADAITVLIGEKLGFTDPNSEQEKTIAKHVRIYRDVLAMLAGGKTFLDVKQIKGCKTALSLVSDDSDDIAVKLRNRLSAMENKPIEELLDIAD